MAQILFPCFDRVILTQGESPRAAPLSELSAAAQTTGVPWQTAANAQQALCAALEQTPAQGLIVVCGSVYLVGRVREIIPELDAKSASLRTTA